MPKKNPSSLLDKLEGTPSKKGRYDDQDQPTPGGSQSSQSLLMSGIKPIGRTPWNRIQKYDVWGRVQLRFDLWLTEYWVRLGLPWSMLDTPAHKEFWNKVDPKLHLKKSLCCQLRLCKALFFLYRHLSFFESYFSKR